MLGGGLSWFEKLPCKNAFVSVLVSHRGTFPFAIHFKHFSEDFTFRCQRCAFQLDHFHGCRSVCCDAVILVDFSCTCESC